MHAVLVMVNYCILQYVKMDHVWRHIKNMICLIREMLPLDLENTMLLFIPWKGKLLMYHPNTQY